MFEFVRGLTFVLGFFAPQYSKPLSPPETQYQFVLSPVPLPANACMSFGLPCSLPGQRNPVQHEVLN